MPVRSAVLARAVSAGAPATVVLGTVPSTDTWIVKQVNIVNAAALAANLVVQAQTVGGALAGRIIAQAVASGATLQWSGWLVLGPTDQLVWVFDQNAVYIWVSGTDLPGHV